MTIDFHTHIFPDHLAYRALESLGENSGSYVPHTDGTVKGLLRSMNRSGVDISVIANIATKPDQAEAILRWSLDIRSPRIIPLGSVHPESPRWEAQLEVFAENGFPGIKLHPMYQDFSVDDQRMIPLYNKARDLGLFILFHSGYDIAFPGDQRARPSRMARIPEICPGLTVIAAHMGGWNHWEEVLEYLAGSDIYMDTSFIFEIPESLRNDILVKHNSERILFGSDSPWCGQNETIDKLCMTCKNYHDLDLLLGENARRLLNLPSQSIPME